MPNIMSVPVSVHQYSLASDSSNHPPIVMWSDKILSTNLTQIITFSSVQESDKCTLIPSPIQSSWHHIFYTGPKDVVCLAMDPIYVACGLWKSLGMVLRRRPGDKAGLKGGGWTQQEQSDWLCTNFMDLAICEGSPWKRLMDLGLFEASIRS